MPHCEKNGSGPCQCIPEKCLNNLELHMPHMEYLASASAKKRNDMLRDASPLFVDALCTGLKMLHKNGVKVHPSHERRARRLMSRNVAKRTKKALVSGKNGAQSRGGKFFADIARALTQDASSGGGFTDFLRGAADVVDASKNIMSHVRSFDQAERRRKMYGG